MGVYYMMLRGWGYVIPRSVIPVKVIGEIMETEGIEIVEQGCYSSDEDSQVIIMLPNDSELLVNIKITLGNEHLYPKLPDNTELAVVCDFGDEEESARLKRLEERKKSLDAVLKSKYPKLYATIKAKFNDRYEQWMFSYYQ